MAIARSLKNYLEEQGVQYDVVRHVHTESSMHTAAAAHVPGDRLVKSVLVADEEGCLLVVVPSSHRVQLGELDRQLERKLGLATEDELRELFKDCERSAQFHRSAQPTGSRRWWTRASPSSRRSGSRRATMSYSSM